jgi:hypothetical protein
MRKLGVRPPVFLALSLIGISGYALDIPPEASRSYSHRGGTIEDASLITSEVMFETFENDLGGVLKPVFDAVWNAAGWEQSIYYEDLKWTGLRRFYPR